MKFGAIPTLDGKVALFTQTEETGDVNSKIALFWTEIECVSYFIPSRR